MRSKSYKAIKEKTPTSAVTVDEALKFIKDHARTKFDETIELHLRLGIDPAKSDQMVRGHVVLPGGPVNQPTIVVFTNDESLQQAALAAGAAQAGGELLINQIKETGTLDADITIATPDLMPKIAAVARILGPKGLMPNPKVGTVTPNPASAVKELQSGKTAFRIDQLGNIHLAIGKTSWEPEKIIANFRAILETVRQSRPAAAKGEFIKSVTLTSTMGPGIKIAA